MKYISDDEEDSPNIVITDEDDIEITEEERGRWARYQMDNADQLEWVGPDTETITEIEGAEQAKEELSLSTLEASILQAGLKIGGFKLEELRWEIPEIAALSEEEYKALKINLAKIKDKLAAAYIEMIKQDMVWVTTGRTRGTHHHLVTPERAEELRRQESEPPKQQAADLGRIATAEPPAEQDTTPEEDAEKRFADKVIGEIGILESNLDNSPGVRATDIRRHLVDTLKLEERDAKFIIKKLEESGRLHRAGNRKGHKYLSVREVEYEKNKNGNGKNEAEQEESAESTVWTAEEVDAAKIILDQTSTRKPGQGMPVKYLIKNADLISLLGKDGILEDLNPFLRKLEREGIINLSSKPVSRGQYKRNPVPHVLFIDKTAYQDWKNNGAWKDEISNRLNELVNSSLPEND